MDRVHRCGSRSLSGRARLSATARLWFFCFSRFSKPASERPIYRAIRKRKFRNIVELGFGTGQRALRMIRVAGLSVPPDEVHYTGIDLFESRAALDGPGMSLRMAHSLVRSTRARVRLLPGDPFGALSRAANNLRGTDLVVVSAGNDPASLAAAWFYFPRMLHDRSLVFVHDIPPEGGGTMRQVNRAEIERWAAGTPMGRAA
jgi:hypothetical protein